MTRKIYRPIVGPEWIVCELTLPWVIQFTNHNIAEWLAQSTTHLGLTRAGHVRALFQIEYWRGKIREREEHKCRQPLYETPGFCLINNLSFYVQITWDLILCAFDFFSQTHTDTDEFYHTCTCSSSKEQYNNCNLCINLHLYNLILHFWSYHFWVTRLINKCNKYP